MVLRIGGLASGMDIDQIVSDLMKVERLPLDRLYQKKQVLEWQRDDYRDMNRLLDELDTNIFDGISMKSSFTKKIVSSSNEAAVTAKSVGSTTDIHTAIRVDQLAEAAYMNSNGDVRLDTTFDPAATLESQITDGKINGFTSNTFTIQAIQADGTLGVEETFTIDPTTDSLNSIIKRINSSNAGVSAFYDEQTGQVSLAARNTGDVAGSDEIVVTGDFLTGTLKLDGTNTKAGQNAKFNFNGIDTERSTNTFTVNGFEYTLNAVTDDGDGITQAGETVTLTSKTDTDSIFNTIKDFVDKYNEVIDKINNEISETRYRDFPPLTEEQKKDMSEKEIELWEEKARSGMLKNDSVLSRGLYQMRDDIYNPIAGLNSDFDQLADIGIKTSSNYRENGKLEINEAKLKEAITANPDAIYDLFNTKVDDANGDIVSEQSGIARRLRETIKETISTIEDKAGNSYSTYAQYTIGKSIKNVSDDIIDFEERLRMTENRYWRQFSEMERAIQRANEQSAYLMQQFG